LKLLYALFNLRPFTWIFDPFGEAQNRHDSLLDSLDKRTFTVGIASDPRCFQKGLRYLSISPEKFDQRGLVLSVKSSVKSIRFLFQSGEISRAHGPQNLVGTARHDI
jgi:hypothetical protein